MKPLFTPEQKKIIVLSSLGGALEFYDFVVFVFFAKIISQLFFPELNPVTALMASFTIFAIGYVVRPLGGILFGHLGDRFGRKTTFVFSIILMAVPTFCIGLLPTFSEAGIFASILLVLMRVLQGLSLGGEIPGSIVFTIESMATSHRGLATGFVLLGINMGMMTGSLMSVCLTHLFSKDYLMAFGWRLPFLFGGLLGIVSYYLRKKLNETPVFQNLDRSFVKKIIPLKEVITKYPLQLCQAATITALSAAMVSILYFYMPTYLSTFFHFPLNELLTLNTINILLFSIPSLFSSYLSDRWGRKNIILIGVVFFSLFIYPLFILFTHHAFALVILVTMICGLFGSLIAGCFPTLMAELFPTEVRYTGSALVYNIGFGIVGGTTPLVATAWIQWSGNLLAPALILTFLGILSLIMLSFTRETYQISLSQDK